MHQASSIENKQDWIKHIREVIQERTIHLRGALKEPIHIPKATTTKHKGRRWAKSRLLSGKKKKRNQFHDNA